MISFIALRRPPRISVGPGDPAGECLALGRLSLSGEGVELAVFPAGFARFALEANLGEASGCPGGWEDAAGKPLALSVLVHAGGKVLALRRRGGPAIQSGAWTASVTGTAEARDAGAADALAAAAMRELREETGLSEADGALSFRGLALAPGKAQPVALFEFACRRAPSEALASIAAWPRFAEEHAGAEFLEPARALSLPLSPVSRLAVELFREGALPSARCSAADREREALRRLARIDPLTGLLNRLGFRERLAEAAEGRGAAVVVFDVDCLKLVNDRHGHRAGDEVLRLFADVLSGAVRGRPGAAAARIGGDEFAALLPGAGLPEAEEFARAVAGDARLETAPAARFSPCGSVRAGWGAAEIPAGAADPEGFLVAADASLRESKGRRGSFALALAAALSRFGDSLTLDEAEAVFDAVLALAERVDPGMRAHSERVGALARSVAEAMGLPAECVRLAGLAGKFHDVGKLGVGPAVLQKEGPLTAGERMLAERHPAAGAEMLGSVRAMALVAEAVRHHHERWDGSGYPDGLRGRGIPLLARIVAACEAFDAARGRLPPGAALAEMRSSGGFDPAVLDALESALGRGIGACAQG